MLTRSKSDTMAREMTEKVRKKFQHDQHLPYLLVYLKKVYKSGTCPKTIRTSEDSSETERESMKKQISNWLSSVVVSTSTRIPEANRTAMKEMPQTRSCTVAVPIIEPGGQVPSLADLPSDFTVAQIMGGAIH
jgi:hypothetical protein